MAGITASRWAKNSKRFRQKLERLKLSEVWEIITDKRFGFRFKIANLICRDYLRNYLASVRIQVWDCMDILEKPHYSDEVKLKHINHKLRKANKTLEDVFDF